MTRELILENLHRLFCFLKDNTVYNSVIKDVSTKGLLDAYACVLDINGAPVRNLSRIYLNDTVWNEFKHDVWSLSISDYSERYDVGLSFYYSGYFWEVLNEDGIKRQREEYIKTCTKTK